MKGLRRSRQRDRRTSNLRLKDVADATGLHEKTILNLEKKGVITSTRDENKWRVFDPSVVTLLRERYKRDPMPPQTVPQPKAIVPVPVDDATQPTTAPQYDLVMVAAPLDARCPGCDGPLATKGTLHATQSVDALPMIRKVAALARKTPGCHLIDTWFHRTQGNVYNENLKVAYVRQESPDDSLVRHMLTLCQVPGRSGLGFDDHLLGRA